jgi:hypothetical protein
MVLFRGESHGYYCEATDLRRWSKGTILVNLAAGMLQAIAAVCLFGLVTC